MTISRHPFRGLVDLPRVVDLIQHMPLACRHVIDFPWRLSSPTINEGRDAVFWENSDGQVIGFAAWQYYWAALDIYLLTTTNKLQLLHFQQIDIPQIFGGGSPFPSKLGLDRVDMPRKNRVISFLAIASACNEISPSIIKVLYI